MWWKGGLTLSECEPRVLFLGPRLRLHDLRLDPRIGNVHLFRRDRYA